MNMFSTFQFILPAVQSVLGEFTPGLHGLCYIHRKSVDESG